MYIRSVGRSVGWALSLVLASLTTSIPTLAHARVETCEASWYGPGFHGRQMANQDEFDMHDPSVVAHKKLPFGTRLRITNLDNGRSIITVVQDRGPYKPGRCVDVSRAGAQALGMLTAGVVPVRVEVVN